MRTRDLISSAACVAALLLAACGGGGGSPYDAQGKLVEILTPASLPPGLTGQSYYVKLEATFPNPPGTYVLSGGSLPLGLVLHPDDGEIVGYPRNVGTFKFELAARDGVDTKLPAGRDVTYAETRREFTVVIGRGPVQILPQTLPVAQYRGSYGYQIDAAGGTPPYVFQQTAGTLPAGLVVSPTGFIGSFPTEVNDPPAPFVFDVTVTDALGAQDTRTLEVDVVVLPLLIETVAVPDASEGFPYDFVFTLASGGGGPPHTWAQEPLGMGETLLSTINMGITTDGHLKSLTAAGPPTAGNYVFTVGVTDEALQHATRQFTLHVRSSPILYSITPRISNKPGPFTASGARFLPGAVLVFNPGGAGAVTVAVTYVNATTLTFPTAPSLSVKGPVTVRVLNPDGGFYDLVAAMLYPANNISFGTKGLIQSGLSSFGLDAADTNKDGLADVVHAGASGFKPFSTYSLTSAVGGLHYLRNEGGLNFTLISLDSGNYTDVKFADVDVDGDPDIVALGITSIKTWLNDGTGNMTPGPTSTLAALPAGISYTSELAIGQFSNDSIPDVAYATNGSVLRGAVWTLIGTGTGAFNQAASAVGTIGSTSFYGVQSLTCTKVDAGATTDIVLAAAYDDSSMPTMRVGLISNGGGISSWFNAGGNTPPNGYCGATSVRRGNFLNLAEPCVVVGSAEDPPDSNSGVGDCTLEICSGANLATRVALSIQAGMVKSIGTGDFDFDGIDDFAVSHKIGQAGGNSPPLSGTPDRVLVYRGSNGAQTQILNLKTGTPTVNQAQSGEVASGDLDGDGRPDLLVTTSFWATDNQPLSYGMPYWQRADSADGDPKAIVFYLNTSQ